MQDNYLSNLKSFFNEQQEDSLRQLKENNIEYADLRASHAKDSYRMEAIKNSLSPEDGQFSEQYINEIYTITGKESDQIYRQGYKDCLRLLCFLDVMEVKL